MTDPSLLWLHLGEMRVITLLFYIISNKLFFLSLRDEFTYGTMVYRRYHAELKFNVFLILIYRRK